MRFIEVDEIENLSLKEVNKLYKSYYNYGLYKMLKHIGINKDFVRAQGMNVYDKEGNKYVDFLGGFGALNLGHNDKRIMETINKYSYRPNMLQISKNTFNAVLANNISYLTGNELTNCYFTNSGTEAVEEAIKLALLYNSGGDILYFSNAYHGKTIGSMSALGAKFEKKKYNKLMSNFIEVPFGNIKAVYEIVKDKDISAILIEPIQGEGGINIAHNKFFKDLRDLCDKKDIILILDEIQTGLGRCGTMFYYEQIGIVPDILCLAKSLSGGIMPIGCIIVEEILWKDTYGKTRNAEMLSSTFGGNTLSCAVAIKTLSIMLEENIPQKAKEMGEYALKKLSFLKDKYKIVKDVRGKGLMIGIEFNNFNGIFSKPYMEALTSYIISELMNKYNIISGFTTNNPSVLRFEPPLIVTEGEIDYFADSIDNILEKYGTMTKMCVEAVKNFGSNLF